MKTQIHITEWNNKGFAECLAGMSDFVKEVTEKKAAEMQTEYGGSGHYTVEVNQEQRFRDGSYGVSRPVAVGRIYADAEATKDEAENKTMSKVISR